MTKIPLSPIPLDIDNPMNNEKFLKYYNVDNKPLKVLFFEPDPNDSGGVIVRYKDVNNDGLKAD